MGKAQALLSKDHLHVEDIIGEMETNRRKAEQDRLNAQIFRDEHEKLKAKYERLAENLENEKMEILEQAKEEARELLAKTQEEVNSILGEVRKMGRKSWKIALRNIGSR